MGLNPFREQRVDITDLILVALAVILTAALVAWAVTGK